VGNELVAQNLRVQAERAAGLFLDLVNQKAIQNGYDPIVGGSSTRIGDIKLVNKVQLFKNKKIAFALKAGITLPTGTPSDPHKVVDVGSGDGQWDYDFGAIVDLTLTPQLTLTGYANYTFQVSDNVTRHLPRATNDTITPDVDEAVYRDLGDIMIGGIIAKLKLFETWTLSTGLAFQRKSADVYLGDQFEAYRYEILTLNTDQQMQNWQAGVSYSTIPLFRKKKFPVPLDAALTYATVLGGINVGSDSIIGFDVALYF